MKSESRNPHSNWRPASSPASTHLYLRDEPVRHAWENLTEAFRYLENKSEAQRAENGIGRAHLRVLILLTNRPGLAVGEVRSRLSVSKQSLNRVMSELFELGLVMCKGDASDRRVRRLFITEKGRALSDLCFEPIREAMTLAYREAGAQAVEGFRYVLACFICHGSLP